MLGHLLVDLLAARRGVEAVVGGDVVQLVGDLLQGPVVGGTVAALELVPHAGHHLLALQRQEGHEHVDQVLLHNVRTSGAGLAFFIEAAQLDDPFHVVEADFAAVDAVLPGVQGSPRYHVAGRVA
ncbi:unnamed protein product, partial [Ixodes pacificus]